MTIAPGTICYIVKTAPGNEAMLGRVVTVMAPAVPMAARGGALLHRIDAAWLRREHRGAAATPRRPRCGRLPDRRVLGANPKQSA